MTRSLSSPPRHRPGSGATGLRAGARLLVVTLPAVDEHVLIVVGEADVSTADQLRDDLIAALAGQPPAVRVDLDGLEFCDLSGLDALHDAAQVAADMGVPLVFSGMSAQLAWLHQTFPATRPSSPRLPSPA